MLRGVRLTLAMSAILFGLAGESRAQRGYGWGGWGGGSTVQGDMARGAGYYAMGAGIYNQRTAIANSINTDTVIRWNQYLWLSQQEANRREYVRQAKRQARDSGSGEQIYKRLRDNPSASDIAKGDALNVILDQITDPKIHSSALRLATAPLGSRTVRDIPFSQASEAVVLSLHQLSAEDGWPLALRGEPFAPVREAYQKAMAKALEEDLNGQISPETLKSVNDAASRVRDALEASPPADRAQAVEARTYVKTLLGMARMIQYPDVEKVLAELEKMKQTSAGSLLGFMHTYNLRFGPATTPRQRTVYNELYPIMVSQRDRILGEAKPNDDGLAKAGTNPPTDFFNGMHLEEKANNGPADKAN
jgi:hypothetical protein